MSKYLLIIISSLLFYINISSQVEYQNIYVGQNAKEVEKEIKYITNSGFTFDALGRVESKIEA